MASLASRCVRRHARPAVSAPLLSGGGAKFSRSVAQRHHTSFFSAASPRLHRSHATWREEPCAILASHLGRRSSTTSPSSSRRLFHAPFRQQRTPTCSTAVFANGLSCGAGLGLDRGLLGAIGAAAVTSSSIRGPAQVRGCRTYSKAQEGAAAGGLGEVCLTPVLRLFGLHSWRRTPRRAHITCTHILAYTHPTGTCRGRR